MVTEAVSHLAGESCLYVGWVEHHRVYPIDHRFRYPIRYFYIDVEQLDAVSSMSRFFSHTRIAPLRFRRRDYYGDPQKSLADSIRGLIRDRKSVDCSGPIYMLTNPRYLGYAMNPVSFYYCFNSTGERVEHIVAEITNTPWEERYCYVLSLDDSIAKGSKQFRYLFPKDFHISPFSPMGVDYDWKFTAPSDSLVVRMDSHRQQKQTFSATMSLRRQPVTAQNIRRLFWKSPLTTWGIAKGIYWQAVKLRAKKATFYDHPKYNKRSDP